MNDESNRLPISTRVSIPLGEIQLSAVRAAGPGGQKVNKTSSAMHLRFDIRASSLPEFYKGRLLALVDEDAPSRMILGAGAGCFTETKIYETAGVALQGDELSPEGVMRRKRASSS